MFHVLHAAVQVTILLVTFAIVRYIEVTYSVETAMGVGLVFGPIPFACMMFCYAVYEDRVLNPMRLRRMFR
jgi:hypothetical protein